MPEHVEKQRGMPLKTRVKIVAGIVLAILVLIIMFQNTEPVPTTMLFWQVTLPHIVLLLIMFVVGCVLGMVAMTLRHRRRAKER